MPRVWLTIRRALPRYQKDAVDTRYVRKAEQFLSRYHGIVDQVGRMRIAEHRHGLAR